MSQHLHAESTSSPGHGCSSPADHSALHAALHAPIMSSGPMLACSMAACAKNIDTNVLDPYCIRSTCEPESPLFQPVQYPEQVYLLDKRLLDPRRPVGVPTEADKMEQLIPYNEVLPLNPSQFATHSQRIAGLRGECPGAFWLRKAAVGLACAVAGSCQPATEPHCWSREALVKAMFVL